MDTAASSGGYQKMTKEMKAYNERWNEYQRKIKRINQRSNNDYFEIVSIPSLYINRKDIISLIIDWFDIDMEADGYIYVIVFLNKTNMDRWYYVGSTTSLRRRINDHLKHNGDFKVSRYLDKINLQLKGILSIDGYNMLSTHTDDYFNEILFEKEREKSYQLALDYETTNIMGGY